MARSKTTRKGAAAPLSKKERLEQQAKADVLATATNSKHWWQRTPKSERPNYTKLPSVFKLTAAAYRLLMLNWKLILGISLTYGLLNILLVRGLSGGLDVTELRSQLDELYKGGWGNVASGFTIFALLVSSSNSGSSDAAAAYQTFLVIITSLALVWSFRQLLSDKAPQLRIRDGFYKGMYPLIPAILVLLVLSLQLIPMLIGGALFSIVISNGIAVTTLETIIWLVIFLLFLTWSLVWIVSTIFALYIVTLADMTPIKALQSAKKLVRFRRGVVLRKLLYLPVFIFLLLAIIIVPVIFIAPVLAQWVFFGLSMFILPAVHAYIYTLYRELLNG